VWGLTPGAYYVAVVPRAGPDASEAAYATTYYPSAARLTEAEEVVVRGGDAMRADLLVQPATGVRVSGTVAVGVMATGGSLPAPFSIELLPHARSPIGVPSARSLPVASAIGGTDLFEIANVPPGAYDLVARATSGGEWHFGRTAVEVGPAGVDGISVEVRPNQVLTGQVVLAPAVARTAVLMDAIR
jgi:hypothetical protein